jgi:hypothetical protein
LKPSIEIKAKLSDHAPGNNFVELRDSILNRINPQVAKIEPKKYLYGVDMLVNKNSDFNRRKIE